MMYPVRLPAALLMLFLAAAAGCDSDSGTIITDTDTTDGQPDGDTADPEPGDGDEGETDEEPGMSCVYASDCAADLSQDCVEGRCVETVGCRDTMQCEDFSLICAKKVDWDAIPKVGRCLKMCNHDGECPADGHCMNGYCQRYPREASEVGTPLKAGTDAVAPLRAGLGLAAMDYPIGMTLGGYGTRRGNISPYQKKMGGSSGVYERQYFKALTLDNGRDALILVRLPTIFPTDFIHHGVVKRVAEVTGRDISRHLILTANHSHCSPARFWTILPGRGFGSLGMDDYLYESYKRMVDSIAEAVVASLNELKPAKLSYVIDENFDPQNRINRDRRQSNDCLAIDGTHLPAGQCKKFKDPFLFMMRVDDFTAPADPKPMALLVNFAAHGTIDGGTDTYSTGDTGTGVELAGQDLFEAETGKKIEVMFFQGMAGDVSPAGDDLGHQHQTQQYVLGSRVYRDWIKKYWDELGQKLTDTVEFEIVQQRIPISRSEIGYRDDEFWSVGKNSGQADAQLEIGAPRRGPHRFGAFQCGAARTDLDDTDPDTKIVDGKLGCVLVMESLVGWPLTEFTKTHLAAFRIGVGSGASKRNLVVPTLPGEPLSAVGVDLVNKMEAKLNQISRDAGRNETYDVVVFGYSQDHQFYLTLPEDWYQGNYETTMCVWGPKFAEWLISKSVKLAETLATPETENLKNNIKPFWFPEAFTQPFRKPLVTARDAIRVTKQPGAEWKRSTKQTVTWIGGDPAIDMPRVMLQRKGDNGQFADVATPTGRAFSDERHNIQLDWENPDLNNPNSNLPNENRWTATIEDGPRLAGGTYRVRITGRRCVSDECRAFAENRSDAASEAYELTTEPFDVTSADIVVHPIAETPGDPRATAVAAPEGGVWKLKAGLAYGPQPTNDTGSTAVFANLETRAISVTDTEVPAEVGGRVHKEDIRTLKVFVEPAGGDAPIEVTGAVAEDARSHRAAITKREKNGDTFTDTWSYVRAGGGPYPATVVKADLGALPAGEHQVRIEVTDAFGNTAVVRRPLVVPAPTR